VTEALPAEVALLFSNVRVRLRRRRLMRVVERVAWLTLIVLAAAVAIHLGLTALSPLLVLLIVLTGASATAAAAALYRPRVEDCARWADSELDGRSAYGATLDASAGRLKGSPAALDWLTARTRAAAPVALTALAHAPRAPWPTAALVASGSGVIAVALILALPGQSPGSAPPIAVGARATTPQSPAQQARSQSVSAAGAQDAVATERSERAAITGQRTPPLETSNESGSAAGGARASGTGAAGGREAGSSADDSTREAMSQILELRAQRHALEAGGAGAGGAGSATYSAESASIAAGSQPVAAPAARPSARARPELTGPVESRLLARYSALREAGP